MLWRLRILMRGAALVGRIEAVCYGVLMATVMGGSVVIFLGATPFIYNEDFAWSIPLTVGSLFAMIGVMQHPSWGRIIASLVLVLCANLDRTPTGWGCVIGAILIADGSPWASEERRTAGGHFRWWRSASFRSLPVAP